MMSNISLTPEELEAMLDRAARRGAKQALSAIGLHDESAAKDINEMRDLLDVWRDTRRGIWSTLVKVTTLAIITFIAGAVWMQLGNK
jgi:2-iminoacetate synthase ThiH